MPRTIFERDLQELQDQILQLGSVVEKNLILAVEALQKSDVNIALNLIKVDEEINEKRINIGLEALTLNCYPAALCR